MLGARRTAIVATILSCALLAGSGSAAAAPAAGTSVDPAKARSVEGAVRYGSGVAVPLKAAVPKWFTRTLAAKVQAAQGRPVAAPAGAPLPSEVGIRPGSWMISPAGCTMNFVFGSPGSYTIGTAGHCAHSGESVVLLTVAPGGGQTVLVDIGKVLTSVDGGPGNDFALVEIRPELQQWVDPTIALIAGPCGSYSGGGPQVVWHVGHGLVVGTGGTPRVGLALTWQQSVFGWDGVASFGDSGSPVRVTNLQAAGNLTHLVVEQYLPSFIVGTRIGRITEIAGPPANAC